MDGWGNQFILNHFITRYGQTLLHLQSLPLRGRQSVRFCRMFGILLPVDHPRSNDFVVERVADRLI